MGKMTISNKKKTNSGMPSWLLLTLVVVIMAGALAACLATVVGAAGIIPRYTTAMKSENFKVSENMMSYFFQTAYGEFTSNTTYTTFETQCSLNQGDNAGKSLSEQTIGGGTYDALLVSGYEGKTWHEFFIDQTKNNVTTYLSYCELAKANGIELDADDKAAIDHEMEDMYTSIKYALYQSNNYNINYLYLSNNECLSYYFGKGVNERDVKKAMELNALASKAEADVRVKLDAAIGTDEINSTYESFPKKYELVDFLNYGFDVKYDQVSKDVLAELGEDAKAEDHEAEILEAYKAEIKKAVQRASALEKITDSDAFLKKAMEYYLEDIYDDTYDSAKTAEKLDDAKKPTAENESTIKTAMIAKIFEELFAEDSKATTGDDVEEKEEKFYAYGIEVTKEYGKFLTALKSDLYDDLYSEKEFTVNEKSTYPDTNEDEENANTKWLYDAERKAGDTYVTDEGDGADGKEVTVEAKSFSVDVYLMVKPRYRDTTIVRNGAYMIFTSSSSAQTALDALNSETEMDLDTFIEIAEHSGAGNYTELTDYAPGQLGSDEFDAWMFDTARAKGDYTKDIVTISSSYVLGYFENEGTLEAWQAQIKNTLLREDLTAENESILNTYKDAIVVKDKVMSKVGK